MPSSLWTPLPAPNELKVVHGAVKVYTSQGGAETRVVTSWNKDFGCCVCFAQLLTCVALDAAELVHKGDLALQLGQYLFRCQYTDSSATQVRAHPSDSRSGSAAARLRGGGRTSTLPHDGPGGPSSLHRYGRNAEQWRHGSAWHMRKAPGYAPTQASVHGAGSSPNAKTNGTSTP